jgi:hypothetical protein
MKRKCGSGWHNSQKTFALRVSTRWKRDGTSVSMLVGDMSRNSWFFQVRISNVLCVISIFYPFTDSPSYYQLWLLTWKESINLQRGIGLHNIIRIFIYLSKTNLQHLLTFTTFSFIAIPYFQPQQPLNLAFIIMLSPTEPNIEDLDTIICWNMTSWCLVESRLHGITSSWTPSSELQISIEILNVYAF